MALRLFALVALLLCLCSAITAEECSTVKCPIGTTCVEEPKECLTTPCPQYSCKVPQGVNPCSEGVCTGDLICLPQPKQCFTTPCIQFECVSPSEYICATAVCPASTRCIPEPKQCFTTPCPQYACVEDPCASSPCPSNSVCLSEPKECFTTPCPQYACMEASQCPQVCPSVYSPVCGSDLMTYANECQLRAKMCTLKTSLYISHSGPCQTEANECNTICPALYSPVCGSDGVTYSNACKLQVNACLTKNAIAVAHQGECSDCNLACTLEYSPVCGSDGNTYSNECNLHATACQTKAQITVKSKGVCPTAEAPCPEFCTMEYRPLCGTDGNTYSNPCFLEATACKSKTTIKIAHEGACDSACDMMCAENYEPVCGTNRLTYSNMCFLEASICLEKQTIAFMHKGACIGTTWADFAKLDTDDNKSVSPSEFIAGSGMTNTDAAQAFSGYDTDNDGKVTAADFTVYGRAQSSDSLSSSSIAFVVVAGCVAILAFMGIGYLYYRNKKNAQGFQVLSESRTNAIFEEEGNDL